MQIFRSLAELAAAKSTPSIVTVGNFDGVHCGHRAVISEVTARARASAQRSVAITFSPHPLAVLQPTAFVQLLQPLESRLAALADCGLDAVLVLPFTREFSHWTAAWFAERVLRNALHATEVHEGENFRFGHNAATDLAGLTELGRQLGFRTQAYKPIVMRGAPVSSSRIRNLIATGAVHHARPLLGRGFTLESTPASGRGYGTRYAVPTINLALQRKTELAPHPEGDAAEHQLLPADGVYITTLAIGSGQNVSRFDGVTNIGNRPTFGEDSFAIETHLFGFEPVDLTETTKLTLTVWHRLRGEQRFAKLDALRAQIEADVQRARRYFALRKVVR